LKEEKERDRRRERKRRKEEEERKKRNIIIINKQFNCCNTVCFNNPGEEWVLGQLLNEV
jgi:hypothetical protein